NSSGGAPGAKPIAQLRYNTPNLPLFVGGSRAFMGDYIGLSPSPAFVPSLSGTRTVWRFNTSAATPTNLHAAWTDNRDVIPPRDGDWSKYTPPKTAATSIFDPTKNSPLCEPDRTGMRNQNIYTARISSGLTFGSPTNAKPLSPTIQRSFIAFIQNNTDRARSFRLSLPGGTSLPGGQVSFLPGAALAQLDLALPPRSSATRTLFATSSDPRARISVNAVEITAPGGTAIPGGLEGVLILNGDSSNPDLLNPDGGGGTPINVAEVFNPDLTNPDLTNPDLTNPDLTNPDLTNPDLTNPDLTNPDLTNPDLTNPDLTNPVIANPDLTNPDLTNPDLTNGSLTDATYRITNRGNTVAPYTVRLVKKTDLPEGFKLQLIVYKVYTTPAAKGCQLLESTRNVLVTNIVNPKLVAPAEAANPDLTNPDLTNATLYLEPGEQARVTLRVLAPTPQAAVDFITESVKPAVVAQAKNTNDPPAAPPRAALVITSLFPPAGRRDAAYTTPLAAIGGTNPLAWSIAAGSLPNGLALNAATGVISGTPTVAGTFRFTVRVTDASTPQQNDSQALSLFIAEPLAIATPAVLPAMKLTVPPPFRLETTGGLAPVRWTVTGGSLPAGVTLLLSGAFSGAPTATGAFSFTARAEDSGNPGQSLTRLFSGTVGPAPSLVSIAPASGTQGKFADVSITGGNTSFTQGVTGINAGPGIAVSQVTVQSPTSLTARLTIAENAALGLRDVSVTTLTETVKLTNGFNVLARPVLLSVSPVALPRAQTLTFTVNGAGTNFTQGVTTAAFSGTGIQVNSVTVASKTALTANVTITAGAALGPRSVTVVTGEETTSLNNAVTVVDLIGRVAGTVFNSTGATPSPGALVRLYRGVPLAPFGIANANALGAFTIEGVPEGPYTLIASDAGGAQLGTAAGTIVNNDQTVTTNVTLTGVATVNVEVRDELNQPAPGALVTLRHNNFAVPAEFQAAGVRQATAGPNGVAAFANFPAGNLRAEASNAAATRTGSVTGTAAPAAVATFTLRFDPPADALRLLTPLPSSARQGQQVDVTFTNPFLNFQATPPTSVNAGSDIAVAGLAIPSANSFRVTLLISDTAATGPRQITALVNGQTVSGAFGIEAGDAVITTFRPDTARQGQSVTFAIGGRFTTWSPGATQVSLGEGVAVRSLVVSSPTSLTVTAAIGTNAAVGPRTATVTSGTQVLTRASAFSITPSVPVILSLTPNSAAQGAAVHVTILAQATSFASGASVVDAGTGIAVSNVAVETPTRINATFTVSPTATLGSRSIVVTTGTETARIDNAFSVTPGAAAIASVTPNAGVQGQAVNVAITGAGTSFAQGVTQINAGVGIAVSNLTVTSPTQLTALFTIAENAAVGPRTVAASTGAQTAALASAFTVNPGAPALLSSLPGAARQGDTVTIAIAGRFTNFAVPLPQVSFGAGVTVNSLAVTSATAMTVNVTVADTAAAGLRTLTVTQNGGSLTLPNALRIDPGLPVLLSVAPNSVRQGQAVNVTVTGRFTSFTQGVTALDFGSGISATNIVVVSPTLLTATVGALLTAPLGPRTVTANTAGQTASLAGAFTVNPGLAALTAVSPAQGQQGQNVRVTIDGVFTNFFQGVTQVNAGAGIAVSNVTVESPTRVSANFQMAEAAAVGARIVTVTTGGEIAQLAGGFTVQAGTPVLLSVTPNSGAPGLTQQITVTGRFTAFTAQTALSLGAGITVNSVTAVNATTLSAQIFLEPAAAAGPRTVTATTPGQAPAALANGYLVSGGLPLIIEVTPNAGQPGTSAPVVVRGLSTNFLAGATQVSFGPGIAVNGVDVRGSDFLTASIAVASGAALGPRTVIVTTGAETATLVNGFTVGDGTPVVSGVFPGMSAQNTTRTVTITGRFTNFVQGTSTVNAGAGIIVGAVTVVSASELRVPLQIGATAEVGLRDIVVTTGAEVARLNGGFIVLTAGDPGIVESFGSVFTVLNTADTTGNVALPASEQIREIAGATFTVLNTADTTGSITLPASEQVREIAGATFTVLNTADTTGSITLPASEQVREIAGATFTVLNTADTTGSITLPASDQIREAFSAIFTLLNTADTTGALANLPLSEQIREAFGAIFTVRNGPP
ncbi:MAG TPA: hypothetical protein DEH78_16615, partial [Solibacterales bacterium]|nr:hypothetical protein [Bryobacterales bacterium]